VSIQSEVQEVTSTPPISSEIWYYKTISDLINGICYYATSFLYNIVVTRIMTHMNIYRLY